MSASNTAWLDPHRAVTLSRPLPSDFPSAGIFTLLGHVTVETTGKQPSGAAVGCNALLTLNAMDECTVGHTRFSQFALAPGPPPGQIVFVTAPRE